MGLNISNKAFKKHNN